VQQPLLPEVVGADTGASVGGGTGASVGGGTGASVGTGAVGHLSHDNGQWTVINVPSISFLLHRLLGFLATHLHLLFLGVPLILTLNLEVESEHSASAAERPKAIVKKKRTRIESLIVEKGKLFESDNWEMGILEESFNCLESAFRFCF